MSRHPDVPDRLRAYLSPRMKYSDPRKVLYTIEEFDDTVLVVGDPDNGAYEWVIVSNDATKLLQARHSNCGYGCSSIALRDGLIAYHGLPRAFDELRKRLMSEPPAGVARARAHYAGLVNDAIKTIDAVEVK